MNSGRLALDPAAVDHVVALAPCGDELLDQLGRVLEIAVEQDAGVLRGELHAAAERGLRAEVAGVRDPDHAPVVPRDGPDHFLGVVGAAVVDEDDFEVDVQLGERRLEPLVHDRDGLAVLVAGDDRLTLCSVSRPNCLDDCWYAALSGRPRYQSAVRVQAVARSWCAAASRAARGPCRCWRTSPATSQLRSGIVKAGSAVDAEQLAGDRRDFADSGLAAGADVERLAVVVRRRFECRVDERLGHVVDVNEVPRNVRADELRVAAVQAVADHVGISRDESSSGP